MDDPTWKINPVTFDHLSLQNLLETIGDGVCILDKSYKILYQNKRHKELLGHHGEELCYKAFHGRNKVCEICPVAISLSTGKSHTTTTQVQLKNRRRKGYTEITGSPLKNSSGEIIASIKIVRDITDRKELELKLHLAKQEAERANQTKSLFLANMSHEIRTPMNAIIGMAKLMQDTSLNHEQHNYINIVQRSADALLRLLNDVLDFSKIAAGQITLNKLSFNLRDCIEKATRTLAPKAHSKGLEVHIAVADEIPQLIGDQFRLRQVLLNLIANAVKFTDKGHIIIQCKKLTIQQDILSTQISITDTGIGIPAEEQANIFKDFQQANCSVSREFGGTGLGLAISKQLIDLMGGRIQVESAPGMGSTFHFTANFPLDPFAQAEQYNFKGLQPEKHLALLAIHNSLNHKALNGWLQSWGFPSRKVNTVDSLKEALQAGSGGDLYPKQLIIDHQFDSHNFTHLLDIIRQHPKTQKIAILLLVSSDQHYPCQLCQGLHFSFCLTKPLAKKELHRHIIDALSGKNCKSVLPYENHKIIPKQHTKPLHILLVEDDKFNRDLGRIVLEKAGHQVVEAENGLEALKALCTMHCCEVILMDVEMPKMNGIMASKVIRQCETGLPPEDSMCPETTQKLAQQLRGKQTPIVAMTANAMQGDREKCIEAGMDYYIPKPFVPEDIFRLLSQFIA